MNAQIAPEVQGHYENLVTVMVGLVRAVDRDIEIIRLSLGEGGELNVELGQVSARDLLVEFLGQHAKEYSAHIMLN